MSPEPPPPAPQDASVVAGYDYFDKPEDLHAQLSGTLGSAAVFRHLRAQSRRPETVAIWQYRKFVTRDELGRATPNYPGMRLVTAAEAASADLSNWQGLESGNLPVRPLPLGSMIRHYHRHHHLSDVLRYAQLAIETGSLSPDETMRFLEAPLLIPGGIELGTFETTAWMEDIERSFAVSLAFVEGGSPYASADAYQRRAVSFCQERLGSWLMLERMNRLYPDGLPARVFGIMHTVTEDVVYRGGS